VIILDSFLTIILRQRRPRVGVITVVSVVSVVTVVTVAVVAVASVGTTLSVASFSATGISLIVSVGLSEKLSGSKPQLANKDARASSTFIVF
jgi:tryptophan-rich sensory protein